MNVGMGDSRENVRGVSLDVSRGRMENVQLEQRQSTGVDVTARSRFPPLPLPLSEAKLEVIIRAVDGRFFIQLVSDQSELGKMLADMRHFYVEGDGSQFPGLTSVAVGTPVAFQSSDGLFHRGEVLEVYPGNLGAKVWSVDKGNLENLALSNVRPLHLKFLNMPRFAVECRAEEGDARAEMQEFLRGEDAKKAEVDFFGQDSDGKWRLKLRKQTLETLVQELGSSSESDDESESSDRIVVSAERKPVPIGVKASIFQHGYRPLPSETLLRESLLVALSAVVSPDDIVVTVKDRGFADNLKTVFSQMKSVYRNSPDSLRMPDFPLGGICAAQFPADGQWYRAMIREIPSESAAHVRVCFVDFGNECLVACDSVRMLKVEFMELPVLGVKCKLLGATPISQSEWSVEVTEFLEQFLEWDVTCIFDRVNEDGSYGVSIFLPDPQEPTEHRIDLLDLMREEHLASPLSVPTEEELVNVDRNIGFDHPQIPFGFRVDHVEAAFVKSPDVFFLHLPNDRNLLVDVTRALEENYVDKPVALIPRPVSRGSACVVFADDQWNRGEIREESDERILVVLADFGAERWCDLQNVCRMKDVDVLWNTPALAVPCRLQGVKSLTGRDWPEATVNKFKSLISGGSRCIFRGKNVDEVYLVDLLLRSGRSVADFLLQGGMAVADDFHEGVECKKLQTVSQCYSVESGCWIWNVPGLPPLGLGIGNGGFMDVVVSFVEGDFQLHIQPKHETENIVKLCFDIQSYYSQLKGDEELLENPKSGDLCVAKYSVDGNYYRAVVLGRIDSRTLTVRFVDYGNKEKVPTAETKYMLPQLQRFPPFGVPCCLHGVTPDENNQNHLLLAKILMSDKISNATIRIDSCVKESLEVTLTFDDMLGNTCTANRIISGLDGMPATTVPRSAPQDKKATSESVKQGKGMKSTEAKDDSSRKKLQAKRGNAYGSDFGSLRHDKKVWRSVEKKNKARDDRAASERSSHLRQEPELAPINEEDKDGSHPAGSRRNSAASTSESVLSSDSVKDILSNCLDTCHVVASICTKVAEYQ